MKLKFFGLTFLRIRRSRCNAAHTWSRWIPKIQHTTQLQKNKLPKQKGWWQLSVVKESNFKCCYSDWIHHHEVCRRRNETQVSGCKLTFEMKADEKRGVGI